jgi:polysaccharide export outer membrane protein
MSKSILAAVLPIVLIVVMAGCGSDNLSKDSITQIIRSGSRPIQAEAKSDDYVIRQGDRIKLEVWGYPEFNAETVVKELGTVTVPTIGEITAAGLTKDQFRQQVIARLSENIQGEVKLSLVVISSIPQKVTIIGAVTRQDNYPLTNEVTLIEALSMAGGTTVESDLRAVKILRGGMSNRPIEVDMTYYVEQGNIESIPIVRPGDTIWVPRTENVMREMSTYFRDVIFLFGFFKLFD